MKAIYNRMLETAKPHLMKGRPDEELHTRTLIQLAPDIIRQEGLDESIMIPAIIFHDAGWGAVPREMLQDFRSRAARLAHMQAGAEIAARVLTNFAYPPDKIARISHLVAVHDYASAGVGRTLEDRDEQILSGIDFLWRVTKIGFAKELKESGRTPREQLEYLSKPAAERYVRSHPALNEKFLELVREREAEYL